MTLPLSVLDLCPVGAGHRSADALRNSVDLARLAEELGFTRYWLAEHHNLPGVASSAPEIMIARIAGETRRIRVGAGGIMLPNHAPLKVVETFRVLEALFPGRIDLGIGRASGTDRMTALALRRMRQHPGAEDFPVQLDELLAFATGSFPADHPFHTVTAVPADVELPPVWLLGSSGFSAQLAARLGLGYAFAHHLNPEGAIPAMRAYREAFVPSSRLHAPRVILTVSVVCADEETEADALAATLDLAWIRVHGGHFDPLAPPDEARAYPYTEEDRARLRANRARQIVGEPARVRDRLLALASEGGADELMITTIVYEHAARRRSYELLAEAFALQPR